MTTTELMAKLAAITSEHGTLDVLISTDRGESSLYSASLVTVKVAEDGEFPEDWNMPPGYKFVHISD